jgi:hypothetical protein
MHRMFPLWLVVGFVLIITAGYAMADDKKVYYEHAPKSALIKDVREPLALPPPIEPTPVKTVSYLPPKPVEVKQETDSLRILWITFICLLSAYSVYIHTQLRRLKREQSEREWERTAGVWPERRSIRAILRRLPDDPAAEQSIAPRADRKGDEQPRFPTRPQQQHTRRDGRERYLVDTIEDNPRHPDGSALAAAARFYGTRTRDDRSGT